MTACATIGIDDNLTASKAAVAVWSANYELTGWINEISSLFIQKVCWDHFFYELIDQSLLDGCMLHIFGMLGGNDHGVDAHGHMVLVIFDSHLALGIGAQPLDLARLAQVLNAFHEFVCKRNGKRHELFGFVGRITEHHALVASTLFCGVFAFSGSSVHALGNIGRLLV